jgi:hypothetical protein
MLADDSYRDLNATAAANLLPGQIVHLRNVVLKNKDGQVEARLNGERNPTAAAAKQITVIDSEDPAVEDLMR